MPTIVLTGGGSGGHITPLLSLARALKQKDPKCRIVYIGLKGEKVEGLQERYKVFDDVRLISSGKYRRYYGQSFLANLIDIKTLALNVRDSFRVLRGIRQARKILKWLKPDVVFSKGSFVAVPVGIAAHRQGVPIITHDSDAVPGLANRILGRWAAMHAVGQAKENYQYPADKIVFTGIPADERIKPVGPMQQAAFKKELGIPAESFVLLVAGGGLGSGRLNDLVGHMAPELLDRYKDLRIILIAGQQHQSEAAGAYNVMSQAQDRVQILGFTPDFYRYSGAADLILCRAGASTLAEFAIQGKACIVIPATQLTGGHQLANVWQLQVEDAAEVLDNDVTPGKLLTAVGALIENKKRRQQLGEKISKLAQPKAADKLAELILQTASAEAAG